MSLESVCMTEAAEGVSDCDRAYAMSIETIRPVPAAVNNALTSKHETSRAAVLEQNPARGGSLFHRHTDLRLQLLLRCSTRVIEINLIADAVPRPVPTRRQPLLQPRPGVGERVVRAKMRRAGVAACGHTSLDQSFR